jgi:RsiW-degrading membrane proteinase PrsW (M82 family)
MDLLVILAAVAATAGLWLRMILKLDRVEPEPLGRVLWVALAGGFLAVLPAAPLNDLFFAASGLLDMTTMPTPDALSAGLFVGFNEELWKLLATMFMVRKLAEFNEPADGLVYATAVAVGFAAFENVVYGLEFGTGVLLVRSVTAMPLHVGVAALWGYALSRRKFLPKEGLGVVVRFYVLAAVIHGVYDAVIFAFPEDWGLFSLVISLVLSWALIRAMAGSFRRLTAQSPFIQAGQCPHCGSLNGYDAMSCTHCGANLSQEFYAPCLGCGAKLPLHMNYCPRCGAGAERETRA